MTYRSKWVKNQSINGPDIRLWSCNKEKYHFFFRKTAAIILAIIIQMK